MVNQLILLLVILSWLTVKAKPLTNLSSQITDSLMYAMCYTRLDIAYAVSRQRNTPVISEKNIDCTSENFEALEGYLRLWVAFGAISCCYWRIYNDATWNSDSEDPMSIIAWSLDLVELLFLRNWKTKHVLPNQRWKLNLTRYHLLVRKQIFKEYTD